MNVFDILNSNWIKLLTGVLSILYNNDNDNNNNNNNGNNNNSNPHSSSFVYIFVIFGVSQCGPPKNAEPHRSAVAGWLYDRNFLFSLL